ncbi:TPA: conjugative transfer signal peptidase TraF [Legionella pneumophila]|nr:conjugative transfer signal peptidase TraF [Legionella pneumophila]HCD9272327.1 conjugative transfer signal peptidase TraF [Legionella pneumophila]HCD9277305.1 conjugative transfer signal peptidase TraF [Legionella pneumophila]HCD9280461.1 conjugative transfer signal peptidase TraF [Legionella pneumophila]HCD9288213.1 conjugative transfer signal peptidase TraF [Legionella pneumophila]
MMLFQEALKRGYLQSGFCPGGLGYMMKRVRAVTGDVVSINHNGVWVNHHRLEHSIPHESDVQGRALPHAHYQNLTVTSSHLLLMTDNSELSFDGRYFGLINRSQVKAVMSPIFTWISTS